MAKLVFRMVNGDTHELSQQVYGATGPMDRGDASVQLSCMMENLMYFTADDKEIVMTKHIVSAKVVD